MFKLNKKYIKIASIFIILLLIIISLFITHILEDNKNTNSKILTINDKIISKINQKDSFIIYFRNNSSNLSKDNDNWISFYKEYFGIDFITYDVSSNKKINECLKLMNDLNITLEKNDIITPSYLFFVEGIPSIKILNLVTEKELYNSLFELGFIDNKYKDVEKIVNSEEEFKEIFSSTKKEVLVFYTDIKETYKVRESMLEIYNKNNIDYHIVYAGISVGAIIDGYMFEQIDDYDIPSVVIVENKKVIDHINTDNQSKIESFLKKNNVI